MPSYDEHDQIEARLRKIERQMGNLKVWLIVLALGLLVSLFGNTAWRFWQISAVCNAIIAENPSLSHSECRLRVHEAWVNNQDTIRLD